MTVQRLSHIGICVSDLERSLAFYRDALGFRELGSLDVSGEEASTLLELPGVVLRAVYLERDGTRIELLHYAEPGHCGDAKPGAMNRLGLTHLSLRVDDLGATLAALERAGAHTLPHTRIENPAFSASAAFVTDPDGTRIELVEAPGDPGALPGARESGA